MRLSSLLLIGVSALTLTACSSLGFESKPVEKAETTAASKAVANNEASAQEQKELATAMGSDSANMEEAAATEPAATDANADVTDNKEYKEAEAMVAPMPADEDLGRPQDVAITPNVPKTCPAVEILPDTKSITYFGDDNLKVGPITARAQLVDIKGGCDYTKDSVIVDIDMIMKGYITKKGRYEGREDLEAFMTFPYFVAVMDADGKLVDKKIMATAMRFQPQVDDLDHAEKITQTIPLKDVSQGAKYTITLGFQLNRQQLDYNRGVVSSDAAPVAITPSADVTPVQKTEESVPAKVEKPVEKKAEAKIEAPKPAAVADTTPTPAPAPAKAGSSASKMKPIVE